MSEKPITPLPAVSVQPGVKPGVGPAPSPVASALRPPVCAQKRYRAALRWGSGAVAGALLALTLVCIHLRPNDQPIRIASTDYWENASRVGLLVLALDGQKGLVFDNSFQKNPYVIGLAWGAHALGWNANRALLVATPFNLLLLAWALVRFGRRWTHRRVPWGLLVAVPLLFWGKGFFQSNEYHLATLPMTATYPSTFSFALALLSLSLLADICRLEQERMGRKNLALLALAALLAACVALTHLLTFLCFFIPTAGLTGFFQARTKRAWARSLLIFPAVALCLLFWPWPEVTFKPLLSYLKQERLGTPEKQKAGSPSLIEKKNDAGEPSTEKQVTFDPDVYQKHYKIGKMLSRAPAIQWGVGLLILLLGFHRRRREVWGLAAAVACFLCAWALTGYLLKITMGYRFLYFCGLFLQLAAVRCIWDFSAGRRRGWLVSVVVLIVVLLPARDCLKEARDRYFKTWPPRFIPSAQLDEVRAWTGNETVLAGNEVSYYLPAFNIQHAWVGRMHRNKINPDIRTWLENQTDENLARAAQVKNASWLLFDKALDGDAAPPQALGSNSKVEVLRLPAESPLLQKTFESERYILFRIQTNAATPSSTSTPPPAPKGETEGGS